jgi:hypothetical protein
MTFDEVIFDKAINSLSSYLFLSDVNKIVKLSFQQQQQQQQ